MTGAVTRSWQSQALDFWLVVLLPTAQFPLAMPSAGAAPAFVTDQASDFRGASDVEAVANKVVVKPGANDTVGSVATATSNLAVFWLSDAPPPPPHAASAAATAKVMPCFVN